jgi:hypothetical protein
MYNLISTEIIKTMSSDSIKGRIKRLLEKYEKVKKQNNQKDLKGLIQDGSMRGSKHVCDMNYLLFIYGSTGLIPSPIGTPHYNHTIGWSQGV